MIDIFCDVVVVGGGPAGIAAAISCARQGAKTILLEKLGCVGGGLTTSYVYPIMGGVENKTIANEIEDKINSLNEVMTPIESAKHILPIMLRESGVTVYIQTQLTKVDRTNDTINFVIANFGNNEYKFTAKQYVDASGDGTLSALAQCKIEVGRREDNVVQPVSIMFQIDGIDKDQTLTCNHEEHYTILSNGKEYLDLCHKACESDELPKTVNIVRLYDMGIKGSRIVNASQVNKVNTLDPTELSIADVELRQQTIKIVNFLKNNIPGFNKIRVNGSSTAIGVRESRRVVGDYTLTGEDLISGRQFSDAIVHNANFPIDIHNPDGAGQGETEGVPHTTKNYDIPYRAICPVGLKNLLTCGRCISGTHRAHASYRVMRICFATGTAAGIAAFLALKTNDIRKIDIKKLQKLLKIAK